MSIIEEKLKIEKQFVKIKNKLVSLNELNLNKEIIDQLICLCDTYEELQISEIQQSEQLINKLYDNIQNNVNLPVDYKKQLLNVIKTLQKSINSLIVNTIINSI